MILSTSVSMALESLRDQCELVADLQNRLQDALEERNRLLVDARKHHVPYTSLRAATGLSRERMTRIIGSTADLESMVEAAQA